MLIKWKTVLAGPLLLLFAVAQPLMADEGPLTYDRVDLSVSASAEVENDTLVAELYAQREGQDAAELASAVNGDVAWAVGLAKKSPGIKVQTLAYRTDPIYRKQVLTGWRVRQSLRLESRDGAKLSQLVGTLQQRLAVSNISYMISPDGRQEAEGELISEAITRFKERAKQVVSELERPGYRLVHMGVNTAGVPYRPQMMRGMAMAEAASVAPTLEAGSQRVQVTVSGTIELETR